MIGNNESHGTPSNSPFLRLAAELRNRIYSYMLERAGTIRIVGSMESSEPLHLSCDQKYVGPSRPDAQILQTCRTIYREATPILYGTNTFMMELGRMPRFLEQIGRSATYVRHLSSRWIEDPLLQLYRPDRPGLLRADSLQSLTIMVGPMVPGEISQAAHMYTVGVWLGYLRDHWSELRSTEADGITYDKIVQFVPWEGITPVTDLYSINSHPSNSADNRILRMQELLSEYLNGCKDGKQWWELD